MHVGDNVKNMTIYVSETMRWMKRSGIATPCLAF